MKLAPMWVGGILTLGAREEKFQLFPLFPSCFALLAKSFSFQACTYREDHYVLKLNNYRLEVGLSGHHVYHEEGFREKYRDEIYSLYVVW